MKKLIVALLVSLAAALAAQPLAEAGAEKIVYDTCSGFFDGWSWHLWCGIAMADPDGSNTVTVTSRESWDGETSANPAWSPDGSKIAFGEGDIFVLNLGDGIRTNLSNHAAYDWGAAWSRDGAQIAFASDRDGPLELYVMNVDGSGPTRLTFNVGFAGRPAWFPEGGRIAFDCQVESGNGDICAINADGTGLVRLTTDPGLDFGAAFSRDGRMAFATTRFGAAPEIAIMDVAGTVSRLGAGVAGWGPTWAPDGTRLAYMSNAANYLGGCSGSFTGGATDGTCLGYVLYNLYVVNADGTGASQFGVGSNPDWGSTVLPPTAAVTYSCRGLTCQFDGSRSADPDGTITSYTWVFGDGTTGSGATVGHTYVAGGAYLATLTVTDNGGATGIQSQNVTVPNAPPAASFTSACSGLTCAFYGSGSSDPDGTIRSLAWNFGDGTTGSGPTMGHTYVAGGTYLATLTVTDNGGATGIQSQNVTVVANAPPVASFTSACSGLTCAFDGSGSSDPDGTIRSLAWNFGDGTTGSGPTVSHTYAAAGTYMATLTVTDSGGATGMGQKSVSVVVNAPPVASFTSACSGLTCSFDGSGSSDADGTITSRAWSFGDGTTGSGPTAGHAYAAGGTYTVTLTVTDTGGATATRGQNVTVSPAFMHVGDLDGASTTQGTTWTALATITVHDSGHRPVAGATVSGAWGTGGTGSCTTSATGQCAVSKSTISNKAGGVIFTVVNVTHATLAYKAGDNHDPDRDSSGSRITVKRP